MNYETIEDKVKEFCIEMLADAEALSDTKDKMIMRAIAFGAVHFACNNLFSGYNSNLAVWWEDFMKLF